MSYLVRHRGVLRAERREHGIDELQSGHEELVVPMDGGRKETILIY
jgi:hypothetical protein